MSKNKSQNITYVDPLDQILEDLSKELPIKIKRGYDIVDYIHQRYPLLDKESISYIIIEFFSSLRETILAGKSVKFNNIFGSIKLLVFKHFRKGRVFTSVKVQITTPEELK